MQNSIRYDERQPKAGASQAYPSGVGSKFNVDGSVRVFAGNTIISYLPAESALRDVLSTLTARLETSPFRNLYTLLPASSWHMTVFEGVCDQIRKPGFWPRDLALDAPLGDCHALYERRLASFDMRTDSPFHMAIAGWRLLGDGFSLHLEPVSSFENERLRTLRDRLSELLQIRHPKHESYVFHLSIAYLIRHLADSEQQSLTALLNTHLSEMPASFELGAPEFCDFNNMFTFHRRLYLESGR